MGQLFSKITNLYQTNESLLNNDLLASPNKSKNIYLPTKLLSNIKNNKSKN
jgi:hypothetical protein